MNRKEKMAQIRFLIAYDRIERGLTISRPVPGAPSWEPRFWPNELKRWTDLKINLANAKSGDLNGISPTDFMTQVIKSAYALFQLDPETH